MSNMSVSSEISKYSIFFSSNVFLMKYIQLSAIDDFIKHGWSLLINRLNKCRQKFANAQHFKSKVNVDIIMLKVLSLHQWQKQTSTSICVYKRRCFHIIITTHCLFPYSCYFNKCAVIIIIIRFSTGNTMPHGVSYHIESLLESVTDGMSSWDFGLKYHATLLLFQQMF